MKVSAAPFAMSSVHQDGLLIEISEIPAETDEHLIARPLLTKAFVLMSLECTETALY